jgi:hypothetical protein
LGLISFIVVLFSVIFAAAQNLFDINIPLYSIRNSFSFSYIMLLIISIIAIIVCIVEFIRKKDSFWPTITITASAYLFLTAANNLLYGFLFNFLERMNV